MKICGLSAFAVLCACIAAPVHAEIYKCVGADGHVMYSNVPEKNCKKLSLEPVPAAPGAAKPAARTPTPSTFPKVEESAQKSRDNDRRRILEGELSGEQKGLEQARKDLAEQEAIFLPEERIKGGAINSLRVQERVQPFKDKVALHERNIEAIQKELSRLR